MCCESGSKQDPPLNPSFVETPEPTQMVTQSRPQGAGVWWSCHAKSPLLSFLCDLGKVLSISEPQFS